VVDGVAYFPGRIRQIIRERHQLASALALETSERERLASELDLLRRTLVLRTAALNRVSETNEMLRAMGRPNP
jgi:hypothetical protein